MVGRSGQQVRRARRCSEVEADEASRSTFGRAWSTVINEADAEAKDRGALADALDAEIVTPLKVVIAKRTELVKKVRYRSRAQARLLRETDAQHFTFYGTLVAERDRLYEARDAAKGRYDSTCADVESHRAKQEHATADHRAEKAGHRFDKASVEMALAKNDYLRAIAVANAAKAHFFAEDLPALTKTWQSIWTVLLQRFTSILLRAGELIVYQRKAAMMLSEREEKSVRGIDAATDQARSVHLIILVWSPYAKRRKSTLCTTCVISLSRRTQNSSRLPSGTTRCVLLLLVEIQVET